MSATRVARWEKALLDGMNTPVRINAPSNAIRVTDLPSLA
jgi:hypothetical protein